MAKGLDTWMKEMKEALKKQGYTKDIPINVFKAQFMVLSGYNKNKVNEWINNFEFCKLIDINGGVVNFK